MFQIYRVPWTVSTWVHLSSTSHREEAKGGNSSMQNARMIMGVVWSKWECRCMLAGESILAVGTLVAVWCDVWFMSSWVGRSVFRHSWGVICHGKWGRWAVISTWPSTGFWEIFPIGFWRFLPPGMCWFFYYYFFNGLVDFLFDHWIWEGLWLLILLVVRLYVLWMPVGRVGWGVSKQFWLNCFMFVGIAEFLACGNYVVSNFDGLQILWASIDS